MGKKRDKAALGPQAAPKPFLGGRGRQAYSNPPAPAQRPIGSPEAVPGQVAQGHHRVAPLVPSTSAIDAQMVYQDRIPEHAVTLELSSPNMGNALYGGVNGARPSVRFEMIDASGAASTFSRDVRAEPRGAAGLAGAEYSGDPRTAPNQYGGVPFVTPARPGDDDPGPNYDRLPGTFQHSPHAERPPGYYFSTRAPGEYQ
jgi:hypothetical protein